MLNTQKIGMSAALISKKSLKQQLRKLVSGTDEEGDEDEEGEAEVIVYIDGS